MMSISFFLSFSTFISCWVAMALEGDCGFYFLWDYRWGNLYDGRWKRRGEEYICILQMGIVVVGIMGVVERPTV